jgi:hypothetical protein
MIRRGVLVCVGILGFLVGCSEPKQSFESPKGVMLDWPAQWTQKVVPGFVFFAFPASKSPLTMTMEVHPVDVSLTATQYLQRLLAEAESVSQLKYQVQWLEHTQAMADSATRARVSYPVDGQRMRFDLLVAIQSGKAYIVRGGGPESLYAQNGKVIEQSVLSLRLPPLQYN